MTSPKDFAGRPAALLRTTASIQLCFFLNFRPCYAYLAFLPKERFIP